MTSIGRPGYCAHCVDTECRDILGEELWPDAPTHASKVFWVCPTCRARIHSNPKGRPLGSAANDELRSARVQVKEKFERIWKNADKHPAYAGLETNAPNAAERIKALAIVRNTARARSRRFLADRLNMPIEHFSVYLWDIEMCRRAWFAMRGIDYDVVRRWAKKNPVQEVEPKADTPAATAEDS